MQTLADRKLNTIASITRLEDEELLSLIEQLLAKPKLEDWADSLTLKERTDLEEGLRDLQAGKTQDFETFMEQMNRKFS
ncbi:MAG: hypothetical protein ACKV1O_15955 [Saprospiraceae bacterium]